MASGICFTVADAKTRMGISVTTYDAQLSSICDGVNAAIVAFLNFDPTESEITEFLDTKGQYELCLRRWPVDTVTAVSLDETGYYGDGDNAFASSTLLTAGTDYVWAYKAGSRRVGVLRRIGTIWPYRQTGRPNRLAPMLDVCPGCVKVTYTIDNTDVLAAAKEAGLMEVAALWAMQATGLGAVLSETIDGGSRSVTPFQPRTKIAGDKFASPMAAQKLVDFRITPVG